MHKRNVNVVRFHLHLGAMVHHRHRHRPPHQPRHKSAHQYTHKRTAHSSRMDRLDSYLGMGRVGPGVVELVDVVPDKGIAVLVEKGGPGGMDGTQDVDDGIAGSVHGNLGALGCGCQGGSWSVWYLAWGETASGGIS